MPRAAGKSPSTAQLRNECKDKQKVLQAEITRLLITYYWLSGEAREMGVTVTGQEVRQSIDHQFPTAAALRRYLSLTGEKPADEELLVRRVLLAAKLEELGRGLTVEQQLRAQVRFNAKLAHRWKPRTSCAPQYVIAECKQYGGSKA